MSISDNENERKASIYQSQSSRPALLRKRIEELKSEKKPGHLDDIAAINAELAALAAAGHR